VLYTKVYLFIADDRVGTFSFSVDNTASDVVLQISDSSNTLQHISVTSSTGTFCQ
jgi:hypothetical protein